MYVHEKTIVKQILAFEEEFTYAFGGCTIIRGLDSTPDDTVLKDARLIIDFHLPTRISCANRYGS